MEFRIIPIHDHWVYKRGDIYFADLGPGVGSKQGGKRPVINCQNNSANLYSPTMTMVPTTSQLKRLDLPCHVLIGREGNLKKDSMAMCEQLGPVNKSDVIGYIGRLSRETMRKVDEGVEAHLHRFIPHELEAP